MRLHFCPFDRNCRRFHAPARFHVFTKQHIVTIALTRAARIPKPPYDEHHVVWFELERRR